MGDMVETEMAAALKHVIEVNYGSLDHPDFSFVEGRFRDRPYRRIEAELQNTFSTREDTDPNDDVSFGYILATGTQKWILRLSLIGDYGFLGRLESDGQITVLTGREEDLSKTERLLVRLLVRHGVSLLDADTLRTPISLNLFNTSPEKVCIYQALFTDTDQLPF
jgi:hypothetical protein